MGVIIVACNMCNQVCVYASFCVDLWDIGGMQMWAYTYAGTAQWNLVKMWKEDQGSK